MSWFGDVADFELFNLGQWGDQLKKNPFRLAYGSADPFSTEVWNTILGTNDKPLVDQFGGAPKQRYEEAEQAGINTGPGATMHAGARTIASMFAGGALGNAMGGSGAAAGNSNAYANGILSNMEQSPGLLATMQKYKPILDAVKTGMDVANQGEDQQLPQAPQLPFGAGVQPGPQSLATIAAQDKQGIDEQLLNSERERQMRRMQRRGLLG